MSRLSETLSRRAPAADARLAGEAERLQCLHATGILDWSEDPGHVRLVETVAAFFRVPIVLFSVIGADHQYLLARHGLDNTVTDRMVSFCQHTILQRGVFEIGDATLSADFEANPFVTGPPHIRFYAGAPVIIDRCHAIGSLCLIDRVPRKLCPGDIRMLEHFAALLSSMVDTGAFSPEGGATSLIDEYTKVTGDRR